MRRALYSSTGSIIISCFFIWSNIHNNHPAILNFGFFLGIPVLLFVIIMISLDLIYQDKQTFTGTLTEKMHNKIYVTDANGDKYTYRLPNEQFDHIEVGKQVELRYYKRTKTVTSIKPTLLAFEDDYSI
ncbi:hypothetical protein D3P07_08770 [Paenibacillus sp. 1011MAR3C5]|uniref:hypothetical protein n=1 Tax=Paenibacillus sp. 1011MAR3C5 TaxID=1675787 RepID=UPI000E6BABB2|nr:hypothetical protein [Paenibacillus sp. 1011MAR3C5]RJE90287.1 hypothetical protein D3P07_08770 [Paenibacillus sp. 1011MAR3C5]